MRMLVLCLVLAGCSTGLSLPETSGSTHGDGKDSCAEHPSAESCRSDPSCQAQMCDACGLESYAGCALTGTPTTCPAVPCVSVCTTHTTEADCDADAACFAVFETSHACECAGDGCCMTFTRCDPGPADCMTARTFCSFAPIVCGDGYQPVVENGCASACVKDSTCASSDQPT